MAGEGGENRRDWDQRRKNFKEIEEAVKILSDVTKRQDKGKGMPNWFGNMEATWNPRRSMFSWSGNLVSFLSSKYYFFCYLNEDMNSKGVNNFPKVTDLVRGSWDLNPGVLDP